MLLAVLNMHIPMSKEDMEEKKQKIAQQNQQIQIEGKELSDNEADQQKQQKEEDKLQDQSMQSAQLPNDKNAAKNIGFYNKHFEFVLTKKETARIHKEFQIFYLNRISFKEKKPKIVGIFIFAYFEMVIF